MKQHLIVMPIYNCKTLTERAIETCLQQDIGPTRVLCGLDRADDGVAEYLRSLHPQVQVVSLLGKGVSAIWNALLSHAFDVLGAPYALVVNNDIRLRPDAYKRLVSDGGPFVTCVGTSSGAKFPDGEPSGEKRPHPDFSCFLIRRECWEQVGKFDETMRIYTSDGDYHIRMHQAGVEAYCLDLPFYHYASGALKQADPDGRERILARAHLDRDAFEAKWGCRMGTTEYYNMFKNGKEHHAQVHNPAEDHNASGDVVSACGDGVGDGRLRHQEADQREP